MARIVGVARKGRDSSLRDRRAEGDRGSSLRGRRENPTHTIPRSTAHERTLCCRHGPRVHARGGATGQYHRPLILGGFAPERTRRRVPESDRSVGNSLTNLTRHGRLLTYSTYGMQL